MKMAGSMGRVMIIRKHIFKLASSFQNDGKSPANDPRSLNFVGIFSDVFHRPGDANLYSLE
jgi:hypothetical protein